MSTYGVTLSITGSLYIEVLADTEEEAIDKAKDECTIDNVETWVVDDNGDPEVVDLDAADDDETVDGGDDHAND